MDRLHLMSTFVNVLEAGGLSAAGRAMGVSSSAVTRAISELEGLLGTQLLIRTTRSVRPTDAGLQYARDARRILQDVEEANASAGGAHAAPRGHLVVTAPVLFGRLRVLPVVLEYLDAHPGVTVACAFTDRVVHLIDDNVDVAIRIGHLPDSALYARPLGHVRQIVCGSPGYLARHGRPHRPADLAMHTVVARSPATAMTAWRFASDAGDAGDELRLVPRLTTTSNEAAIDAAVAGFGLVRVLSYQVEALVARGVLEVVLRAFEPSPQPVHLLHREGRRGSRKVRGFVDLALARLSTGDMGTVRTDAAQVPPAVATGTPAMSIPVAAT